MKILLVEDDPTTADFIARGLREDGHSIDHLSNGRDGLVQAIDGSYDVSIVDRMLPGLDGLSLVRAVRAAGVPTPIIFLTAVGGVDDRIEGLNAGADDYMVKPFHPTELDARVNALLRRPPSYTGRKLRVRDIELDSSAGLVLKDGKEIELTAKEFSLLELLMRYPNQSFSLEAILDRVWDSDSSASIDSVRTHMKTLRKKLGDSEENGYIRTKRGQGYRIVDN